MIRLIRDFGSWRIQLEDGEPVRVFLPNEKLKLPKKQRGAVLGGLLRKLRAHSQERLERLSKDNWWSSPSHPGWSYQWLRRRT